MATCEVTLAYPSGQICIVLCGTDFMGTGVHLVDRSQAHITEALRTLLTGVRSTHAIQTSETNVPTGVARFKDSHALSKIGLLKCTEAH